MKEERFEKVVEGDKDELMDIWHFGLVSLGLPFLLLLSEINFFKIVLMAFVDGMIFHAFAISLRNYVHSRKVYWRKMK